VTKSFGFEQVAAKIQNICIRAQFRYSELYLIFNEPIKKPFFKDLSIIHINKIKARPCRHLTRLILQAPSLTFKYKYCNKETARSIDKPFF